MIKYLTLLLPIIFLFSCKSEGSNKKNGAEFDAAYPEMYKALGLPEYRRGTLGSVTGKSEGVKTVHTFIINTDDPPTYVRDFIMPAMSDLGWRHINTRNRISKDISDQDLFYASFVKGGNKFDVNASSTPDGSTKAKFTLSVFND